MDRGDALRLLAIVGVAFVVACGGTSEPPSRPPTAELGPIPPLPPSPSRPAEAEELPVDDAGAPIMPKILSRHPGSMVTFAEPPALGAACPAPVARRTGDPFDACGTKKRTSVRWNTSSSFTAENAPCAMTKLAAQQPGEPYERSACVKDGRLWAKSLCVMCRLPFSGWSAVAEIAELTAAQALAIQEELALPRAKPFLDASAWSSAIASAKAR